MAVEINEALGFRCRQNLYLVPKIYMYEPTLLVEEEVKMSG